MCEKGKFWNVQRIYHKIFIVLLRNFPIMQGVNKKIIRFGHLENFEYMQKGEEYYELFFSFMICSIRTTNVTNYTKSEKKRTDLK